ncbi:Bug family tripartite tricarboxylate transporter substrate binding protein [Ideonella margarita]|uniref:Tripartite tricarboxylate transporter substrate-binding protein n=1 Tax=Ideonella margarita TaxID=2984191 RepID=A0ABU9C294_9BURK
MPRHHTARRQLLALGALPLLGLPAVSAWAQAFPDRQLKLTVGFPPGTGPDVVARLIGQKLGENLKQTLVIDNRAGAGGQIGTQAVAKSAPDGYSLLLGEVGSISIAPPAFSKLPYDPARELTVLSEVVRADFLLVVPATSPLKTVAEFVKAAKGAGDRVNMATFGAGTPGHFGAEMLSEQAGFPVEPIHYRSTGDAVTAIIAGDVKGAFVSTALGVAQIKGGKMRALATTAPVRSSLLPDVPTFAESGLPKVDFSSWFAIFAPAGTPAPVLDLLNRQIVAAVQAPEVRQKLVEAGFTVLGTARADAERMVKAESARWAAVVKATGFKGD